MFFWQMDKTAQQFNTHKNNAGFSWRYRVSCGRIRGKKDRKRKNPFGEDRLMWILCDPTDLKGASFYMTFRASTAIPLVASSYE
jgi:hypothetical protein